MDTRHHPPKCDRDNLRPIRLGSDAQNGCPTPPQNVTETSCVRSASDQALGMDARHHPKMWQRQSASDPPRIRRSKWMTDATPKMYQRQNASDLPRMSVSGTNQIACSEIFVRYRFQSRIVESFKLFDFALIFTQIQNTTWSCTENKGTWQWKNSRADQVSFGMIENSYSFRKHSFGTIYWLTSDPGAGVRAICLEL